MCLDGGNLQELFVSNLQGGNFWTERYTSQAEIQGAGQPCGGCVTIDNQASPDYGLLIQRSSSPVNFLGSSRKSEVIPSDGSMGNNESCDIVATTTPDIYDYYDGDLWEPGKAAQLSPWTRPNIYGYSVAYTVPASYYDSGWHVIDNIRYTSANDGTIQFDYIKDPHTSAATFFIREDSWMGAESADSTFQGEVRVVNGATLKFDADPTGQRVINFEGGLYVAAGARISVGEGVTLKFGRDTQFIVFGQLDVYGTLANQVTFAPIIKYDDDPQNGGWKGFNYRPGSFGTMRNASIEDVHSGASGAQDNSVYVFNGDPVFEGVSITGGNGDGLFVTGSQADVVVRSSADRASVIRFHDDRSALAASGADVTLDGVLLEGGTVGVYTINDGDIFMRQSTIRGVNQVGARAYDQGRVIFGLLGNGNQVTGQNNLLENTPNSSLRADMGATLYGGGAGIQYDINYRNNSFLLNSGNANQKHAQVDDSDVIAECSYWDRVAGPDPARVTVTGGGMFDGSPYLSSPPSATTPCGTAVPGITGGGDTAGARGVADKRSDD